MNRFILPVSALLMLSAPVLAQRKTTLSKHSHTRLLTRRTAAAEPVPVTVDSAQIASRNGSVKPDSTRQTASAQTAHADRSFSASTAVRTSPEAAIQPQNIIRSYYVDLAYNKTVSIIFPTAVRSVDLGSRSIMADKAADVENVLKVKAAQIGFNETNFSVMTADGTFYSFVVNYNETPAVLALNLTASSTSQPLRTAEPITLADRSQPINSTDTQDGNIQFAGVKATQSDIVYNSDRILHYRGWGRRGAEANKLKAQLRGLYVNDNVLYYRLVISNRSNLNYDIDYVRYFVVDSKTAKLTARQEIELQPIYVHNEAITTVRGHQRIERVYAFQRFTIPNSKQLLIQIGEQNGGRNLSFIVENKDIMKAKPL
ncbi:conjugative transposon protein TraN [Spirosoma fluminis]